ncbi:hypothetical protein D3C72_359080 [compost metagenome]
MTNDAFMLETFAHVTEPAWRDPLPIPDALDPVEALPPELLPAPLQTHLLDVAERAQIPVEFVAVSSIVALASVVGTSIRIRPKRHDDWMVTPNLWGALVGGPSSGKSPALSAALAPLRQLEREAEELHEEAMRSHMFTAMEAKARLEALKDKLKRAARDGKDTEALRLEFLADGDPEEPVKRRFMANDSTVEALGVLLNQSPRGILVSRDELTGWFRQLEKPGHEGDRAFYLEAWNGKDSFRYDRIGRGELSIASACVSIIGGIQPSKLRGLLDGVRDGGYDNDGLLQRFQLMVYPDLPSEAYRAVDRAPNVEAEHRVRRVFEFLAKVEPGLIADRVGDDGPHFLRFEDEAQEFFSVWLVEIMNRSRALGDSLMGAHLAKFPILMSSLALLFHLIEVADGTASGGGVSLEASEMAAAWCAFLEKHAKRVYGMAAANEFARAAELVKHIEAGDLPSPFRAREARLKGWHLLSEAAHVQEALEVAEEFGWIRGVEKDGGKLGGRPTVEYFIHPQYAPKEKAEVTP